MEELKVKVVEVSQEKEQPQGNDYIRVTVEIDGRKIAVWTTESNINALWKSHATLTLLATQDLPTFGYNMIDPLKSWCWGSILFYPFKISRFS